MKEDIFVEDTQDYKLEGKVLDSHGNIKIRITHKFGGKHFAEHDKIQVLDIQNKILGSEKINKKNIKYIFENIKKKRNY